MQSVDKVRAKLVGEVGGYGSVAQDLDPKRARAARETVASAVGTMEEETIIA